MASRELRLRPRRANGSSQFEAADSNVTDHQTVRADAVVVAAGASRRMDGVDKLAVDLVGRPLLAWSVEAIAAAAEVERIVVVVGGTSRSGVEGAQWLPDKVVGIVKGGERRQDSVGAGIAALDGLDGLQRRAGSDGRVVLIHDGARPLVSPALVSAVARAAAEHGAAIPVLPVFETLKAVDGDVVAATVDRSGLAAAQTPQGIRRDVLNRALTGRSFGDPDTWTDEAALLEACKIPVHAIPGESSNLKVTVPADLRQAELVLMSGRRSWTGFGEDSHPFGEGFPLRLGGIEFGSTPRLHGHSDGDVVLHAVADALLGAAHLGDLGRLFPADDRTPRGVASTELLVDVVRRLADRGLRPASLDITIVAARPRLGARLDEVRDRIADLIGLDPSTVNVKASTGNLEGLGGTGRGIVASAVAEVESIR
jgi:2-C-methyl-D-erythritol 4-phosphate cytidylyltransferase/2-C-methyl-D-erythritol 2,4-cyclodiphosphate synthase